MAVSRVPVVPPHLSVPRPSCPTGGGQDGRGGSDVAAGAADEGWVAVGHGGGGASIDDTHLAGRSLFEVEHEVSVQEMAKWDEMMDVGLMPYLRLHPDRFHRRVRRGIPPRLRWEVWKMKLGPDLRVLGQRFRELCDEKNTWTDQIDIDIARTFAELRSFGEEQRQKLRRVLNAYAGYNPTVGYCQGMNFVAGLLLLASDMREDESFAVLTCLMEPSFGLSGFYRERLPLLRRYLRSCERLVADTVPDLRDHFIREGVQPAMYLHQWFLTLFINCFPLSMVMIIWDVIVCEGLPVILRIAVSILQVLKDSLLTMHLEEIIKFFRMMRKYDDQSGELNAFKIGQLLMKHTEHVVIPEGTLDYLTKRDICDEEGLQESDDWEADLVSASWAQSFSKMFAFGYSKRRSTRSASPTA